MGLIRKNQVQSYENRFIDCDFINPDFKKLADSFGINHILIKAEEDLIIDSNAQRVLDAQITAGLIKKIKEEEVLNEKILQQQKIAIIGQTFGAISEILGANSKAGKAAAIAQATINTYQGITEVWSTKSTLPEPFATISRIASTATVLASGLSAVKSIKSQQLPALPGGGSGGGSIAVSAPPQIPSFNIVGQSQGNQIAQSLSQNPIKAFVVSKDVTTQQELDRNVLSTASLG